MGWCGYGLYDGDGTASIQMSIVEAAGYNKDIPLHNKAPIEDIVEWNVGKQKLHIAVVSDVYTKWNKIAKQMMPKGKRFKDEDDAMSYLMAADFFFKHESQMPGNVLQKGIEAAQYLIEDGHADSFNKPSMRKRVLENFKEKLENFNPVNYFVT